MLCEGIREAVKAAWEQGADEKVRGGGVLTPSPVYPEPHLVGLNGLQRHARHGRVGGPSVAVANPCVQVI